MEITKENTQKMIDEVLEAYPEKARKKRARHLIPNDPNAGSRCGLRSNIKCIPGVMTSRGCA